MSDVEIVTATAEHIEVLLLSMRKKDREEAANAGLALSRAVWRSYRGCVFAKAAFVDGEIAAVWGIGGGLGSVGRPWLFTTPAVERAKMAFLRTARAEVADMLATYPRLLGVVDDAYVGALRLLQAIGFTLSEPFAYGRFGMPFREYRLERR